MKVRRAFVADRYAPLVEALYDGSTEKYVETEVTYEDGRKGTVSATVRIKDARTYRGRGAHARGGRMNARAESADMPRADDGIAPGELLMDVQQRLAVASAA